MRSGAGCCCNPRKRRAALSRKSKATSTRPTPTASSSASYGKYCTRERGRRKKRSGKSPFVFDANLAFGRRFSKKLVILNSVPCFIKIIFKQNNSSTIHLFLNKNQLCSSLDVSHVLTCLQAAVPLASERDEQACAGVVGFAGARAQRHHHQQPRTQQQPARRTVSRFLSYFVLYYYDYV